MKSEVRWDGVRGGLRREYRALGLGHGEERGEICMRWGGVMRGLIGDKLPNFSEPYGRAWQGLAHFHLKSLRRRSLSQPPLV